MLRKINCVLKIGRASEASVLFTPINFNHKNKQTKVCLLKVRQMLGQILLCLKLGQILMKTNLVSLHKYSAGLSIIARIRPSASKDYRRRM